jgi:hypothetical protein
MGSIASDLLVIISIPQKTEEAKLCGRAPGMAMQVGLCGSGDCNWEAIPTGLGEDFIVEESGYDPEGGAYFDALTDVL